MLEKQWVLAGSRPHRQHNFMGKKHIIEANQEELIKEQEKIDQKVGKDAKLKQSARVQEGKIYVSSSYNNTMLTLTNSKGQVLAWKTAGAVGFKGTKKSTSFAAAKATEAIVNVCRKMGIEKLEILVKGIGAGRESAVRTIVAQGLNVVSIKDITPIPHNGCRPKKVRHP